MGIFDLVEDLEAQEATMAHCAGSTEKLRAEPYLLKLPISLIRSLCGGVCLFLRETRRACD